MTIKIPRTNTKILQHYGEFHTHNDKILDNFKVKKS
jgi:hypothetical protein